MCKVENSKKIVSMKLFRGSPTLNHAMHCMDLADQGKKKFGTWSAFKFSTKNKVTKTYKKKICNYMLQPDGNYFVMVDDCFGAQPDVSMLSDGNKWLYYPNLVKALKDAGYTEVKYKALNNKDLKYALTDSFAI